MSSEVPPPPMAVIREFVFELETQERDVACLRFFKMPRLSCLQTNETRIDWGDGTIEYVFCPLSDSDLECMMADSEAQPVQCFEHTFATAGAHRVRLFTPSGFVSVQQLPWQTTRLLSPLPTLTRGETDTHGTLQGAHVLPKLVPNDPNGRSQLCWLAPQLLSANPQLTHFDEAFSQAQFEQIDPDFFAPVTRIVSLRRTFADSALQHIPFGLIAKCEALAYAQQTFAGLRHLLTIENPFGSSPVALHVEGFLDGAAHPFFHWCDPTRRTQMGWIRPLPTLDNQSFDFVWCARQTHTPEKVIAFYPMDLALEGGFLIDWGDGSAAQYADWSSVPHLKHLWPDTAEHTVRLHFLDDNAVRPFKLLDRVRRILTPLPRFWPRNIGRLGDYCGWAANARELTDLPEGLFALNPDITNLEQAFAGCLRLHRVPDSIIDGLPQLLTVNGMFAFCKNLPRLPASFAAHPRDTSYDYFYAESKP